MDAKTLSKYGLNLSKIRLLLWSKDQTKKPFLLWIGKEHVKQSTWVQMTASDQSEYQHIVYRITGRWRRWFDRSLRAWQNRKVFRGNAHAIECISLYLGAYQKRIQKNGCPTTSVKPLSKNHAPSRVHPHQWNLTYSPLSHWYITQSPRITLDQTKTRSLAFNLASAHVYQVLKKDNLVQTWKARYTFEWQDKNKEIGWFSIMPVHADLLKSKVLNSSKKVSKHVSDMKHYIHYKAGYGMIPDHIFYFIQTHIQQLLQRQIYPYKPQDIRVLHWQPQAELNIPSTLARTPQQVPTFLSQSWQVHYQNPIWMITQNQRDTQKIDTQKIDTQKIDTQSVVHAIVENKQLRQWFDTLQSVGAGAKIASSFFAIQSHAQKINDLQDIEYAHQPYKVGRLSIKRISHTMCGVQPPVIQTDEQEDFDVSNNVIANPKVNTKVNQAVQTTIHSCNDWMDLWFNPRFKSFMLQRSWDDLLIDLNRAHVRSIWTTLQQNSTPITAPLQPL